MKSSGPTPETLEALQKRVDELATISPMKSDQEAARLALARNSFMGKKVTPPSTPESNNHIAKPGSYSRR